MRLHEKIPRIYQCIENRFSKEASFRYEEFMQKVTGDKSSVSSLETIREEIGKEMEEKTPRRKEREWEKMDRQQNTP